MNSYQQTQVLLVAGTVAMLCAMDYLVLARVRWKRALLTALLVDLLVQWLFWMSR